MSLRDLLDRQFGVRTRPVENPLDVTSLGTDVTRILSNNPNRLGFTVLNLSANVVYIGLSRNVNAGVGTEQGIRLDANGGQAVAIWDEDFDMVAWEWYAVATAVDSQIYVLEEVEY